MKRSCQTRLSEVVNTRRTMSVRACSTSVLSRRTSDRRRSSSAIASVIPTRDASGLWGYDHGRYTRAPLLDAFLTDRIPRPLSGGETKPDLVPTHPNVGSELIQMAPEEVQGRVEKWASE